MALAVVLPDGANLRWASKFGWNWREGLYRCPPDQLLRAAQSLGVPPSQILAARQAGKAAARAVETVEGRSRAYRRELHDRLVEEVLSRLEGHLATNLSVAYHNPTEAN